MSVGASSGDPSVSTKHVSDRRLGRPDDGEGESDDPARCRCRLDESRDAQRGGTQLRRRASTTLGDIDDHQQHARQYHGESDRKRQRSVEGKGRAHLLT